MTIALLTALIAMVAAAAQAASGFGFALLAVPLLIPFLGTAGAVVAVTALSLVLTVGGAAVERAHVAWRPVALISLTALLGLPLGMLVLEHLNEHVLMLMIGLVVIATTVLLARGRLLPVRGGGAVAAAGVLSGAMLTSTGMNGPPLVAVMQSMRWQPRQLRASLQAAFVLQDALAVGAFALLGRLDVGLLSNIAVAIPALAVGWWVGDRLFVRLGRAGFRRLVVIMLLASGVMAVIQALWPLIGG